MRLELTTYRLTAGRAADCAIQELMQQQSRTKKFDNLDFVQNSPWRDSNPQSLPPEGSALSIRPQGQLHLAKKEAERFYRDLNPDYKDQNLGC